MAQEKDRKKPKRTPRSKGTATEEKPYVEQFSELLMVHNKNDPKAGLGVVSQVDEKGNYRTVPPDRKHENSFLKFDRNSSILENFIRNFWRQFKEPTHFRLLRMTYNDYKRNRQALDDLAKGKQTDAVKEFLKHYEIRPRKQEEQQNTNEKENESMAKKQQPQPEQQQQPQQQPEQLTQVEQAAQGMEGQPAGEQQSPVYRYNENMIDWEALGKVGISKEMLEQSGALDGMLRGYKFSRPTETETFKRKGHKTGKSLSVSERTVCNNIRHNRIRASDTYARTASYLFFSFLSEEVPYLGGKVQVLPVLVHAIIADDSFLTVTGKCTLRHAEQFGKIHIVQKLVTVQTLLQTVHMVQFLFYAGKSLHHGSDQPFQYFIFYVWHNYFIFTVNDSYPFVRTGRVYALLR